MTDTSPRCQIMVVDDDAAALKALDRLLTHWGYSTVCFMRFEEARASLSHQTPDALIVDIRLGEHNGLQLVHLAKQSNPTMRIVVVSGFDDAVLREDAASAGAEYLLKPVDLPRLKELLPAPIAG